MTLQADPQRTVELTAFVFDDDEPTAPLAVEKRPRARSVAPIVAPIAAAFVASVGAAVWRLTSRPRPSLLRPRNAGLGVAGATLVGLGLARWQLQRMFTPTPRFQLESKHGALEVRRYPPLRAVETRVDAKWDEALDEGFRRLATFIFGKNARGEKIDMVAPVLGSSDGRTFHITFVLPDGIKPPSPVDTHLSFVELPPRRMACLRFRGRYDAAGIQAGKKELAHALVENGLRPRGEVMFAGYDPPTTLPFLRRNELWVEIAP